MYGGKTQVSFSSFILSPPSGQMNVINWEYIDFYLGKTATLHGVFVVAPNVFLKGKHTCMFYSPLLRGKLAFDSPNSKNKVSFKLS